MDKKIEQTEQKVIVSDNAKTGDITLVEKIINIVRQPAAWQDEIWRFLLKNKGFIFVAIALEVTLGAIFVWYRDLYLISTWYWGLVAALLPAATWGWYTWAWLGRGQVKLILTLLVTISLVGLLGWQTWQAVFPERFDPQVFGIAVAELGEGPDFRRTEKAREITDQVYEHLCRAIGKEFAADTQDPCGIEAKTPGTGRVKLKRIGVMPDSQTARSFGERMGANIVVWGQVLVSDVGAAVIRFQILETPDRAVNPEYPLVLPVTSASTEIFASEFDLASNPMKLKEIIAQQSTIITSFTLGLAAYLDRDFPQAVKQLETTVQAVETSPSLDISPDGMSLLYYYLGKANHARGEIEQGQEWLVRAQESNPQEPAVPLSLALGYRSLGQHQEKDVTLGMAFGLIRDWLQTHPDDQAAIYDRGIVHHMRDEFEDAMLDYEALIERDPDFYVAYIGLGQVAAALGHFDRAEDVLRDAIALAEDAGTNAAWAYLNLALIYQSAVKPDLARTAYLRAVERAPGVDWMYYYLARFLESQQEMDAARSTYQTMTEVTRNKGWAYGVLAGFLKSHGLQKEALENYKRAVHHQSEDALLHAYLAETYLALGDVDNALQAYEESIQYGAHLYYVYASYAGALFRSGDLKRAAQMYERSLELRPLDRAVLLNLGQTYESLGESNRAAELYSHILSLSDHFSEETILVARDRLQALGVVSP